MKSQDVWGNVPDGGHILDGTGGLDIQAFPIIPVLGVALEAADPGLAGEWVCPLQVIPN